MVSFRLNSYCANNSEMVYLTYLYISTTCNLSWKINIFMWNKSGPLKWPKLNLIQTSTTAPIWGKLKFWSLKVCTYLSENAANFQSCKIIFRTFPIQCTRSLLVISHFGNILRADALPVKFPEKIYSPPPVKDPRV